MAPRCPALLLFSPGTMLGKRACVHHLFLQNNFLDWRVRPHRCTKRRAPKDIEWRLQYCASPKEGRDITFAGHLFWRPLLGYISLAFPLDHNIKPLYRVLERWHNIYFDMKSGSVDVPIEAAHRLTKARVMELAGCSCLSQGRVMLGRTKESIDGYTTAIQAILAF